jgi:ribosomal protein S18 acetylase RimI-like enzyme
MPEIMPIKFQTKNGRKVILRSFQSDDYLAVESFQKSVAQQSTHTLKYPEMPVPPQERILSLWKECQEHAVNLHVGAFLGEQVVGNIRLFQRNPSHPWIRHVAAFGMAVLKDQWGQGIGQRLLEAAEASAQANGIKRIEAEVRCSNASGIALYKKTGFKIEGIREKAALINGEFQDEYFIAKLIGSLS